tara:strand:+ start:64 stop:177 length:114 start_codon:yes stop_codon:yes gene_type:complete
LKWYITEQVKNNVEEREVVVDVSLSFLDRKGKDVKTS